MKPMRGVSELPAPLDFNGCDTKPGSIEPAEVLVNPGACRTFAQADHELITEIRRRGYKVYPEKRVRIYEARKVIDRREILEHRSTEGLARLTEYVDRSNAHAIGAELMQSGALIRSRREADDYRGEIRTAQVCAIIPNDWDFESEMWGVRS